MRLRSVLVKLQESSDLRLHRSSKFKRFHATIFYSLSLVRHFLVWSEILIHPQCSQSYRLIKSRCQEAKMSRCHWYMNMLTLQIRSSQDVKLPTNLVPDKRSTRRNMPGLFIHHITQCCHYCCCPSCSCSCCSCCCSLFLFLLLLFDFNFHKVLQGETVVDPVDSMFLLLLFLLLLLLFVLAFW